MVMRKVLLTAFLNLMMIGYVNAEGIKVPISILSEPNDDNGHIRHAPPKRKMPIVEIDNNYIEVSFLTSGANFRMALIDDSDNVICEVASITSTNMKFDIPRGFIEKANSIIITIDGITYWGEF